MLFFSFLLLLILVRTRRQTGTVKWLFVILLPYQNYRLVLPSLFPLLLNLILRRISSLFLLRMGSHAGSSSSCLLIESWTIEYIASFVRLLARVLQTEPNRTEPTVNRRFGAGSVVIFSVRFGFGYDPWRFGSVAGMISDGSVRLRVWSLTVRFGCGFYFKFRRFFLGCLMQSWLGILSKNCASQWHLSVRRGNIRRYLVGVHFHY